MQLVSQGAEHRFLDFTDMLGAIAAHFFLLRFLFNIEFAQIFDFVRDPLKQVLTVCRRDKFIELLLLIFFALFTQLDRKSVV